MSRVKVTELTAASDPLAPSDLFKGVQGVTSTPVSRKVSLAQIIGSLSSVFYKGAYSAGVTYAAAEMVYDPSGTGLYQSQTAGNLGQSLANTSYWKKIFDASGGGSGQSAFTLTTAGFTVPAINGTVAVTVVATSPFNVDQVLHLESAGYYQVTAIASGTAMTLRNLGYSGNAAESASIATGKKVSPGGLKGVDGTNAYSTTTASFTMPLSGQTVTVAVDGNAWNYIGQVVSMQTAGTFVVTALPTSTSLTLENTGASGNAAPTTSITSGKKLVNGSGGGGAATRTGVPREIYIDAAAMVPRTSNPPEVLSQEQGTSKVHMDKLAFDKSSQEWVNFKVAMPSTWDRQPVKAKFYWEPRGGSNGQVVEWAIQCVGFKDGDAIDSGFGAARTVQDTRLLADGVHLSAATAGIEVAGYYGTSLNPLLNFAVRRMADNGGDTLDADANLLGVLIQYGELSVEPAAW